MQGEIFDNVYEGSEPYVFISYSHRDEAVMAKIRRLMLDNNVRYWYDNGLHSGDDWNLLIASHVKNAAICLFLLSHDSAGSEYVKNELNFAIKNNVPVHTLVLEKFALPPDIDMMTGRKQMVQYETGYELKLIRSFPKTVFYKENVQSEPEAPEQQDTAKNERKPGPVTAGFGDPAVVHKKKTPTLKKIPGMRKNKKEIPLKIIIPAIIIIGIAAGVFITLWYINNFLVYIADKEFTSSESLVSLSDKTLSQQDLDSISKFKSLSFLCLTNCELPENADLNKIFSSVKGHVELDNCGITDSQLASVDFSGCSVTYLVLNNNKAITDLSVLRPLGAETERLSFDGCSVSDISFMEDFPKVQEFSAADNGISSLLPLENCTALKKIDVSGNELNDLSGIERCIYLETIKAGNNHIADLGGLENATVLQEADLCGNEITDITVLSKSRESLKKVYLADNKLKSLDLLTLADLHELDVSGNSLSVLVLYWNQMTVLKAAHNKISKIENYSSCERLGELDLSYNALESTENIRLTGSALYAISGVSLDLSHNNIKELVLPDVSYKYLSVSDNPVTSLGPINGYKIRTLEFDYNADIDFEALAGDNTNEYRIYDCPLDRQIYVEKTLGKYQTVFLSKQTGENADQNTDK